MGITQEWPPKNGKQVYSQNGFSPWFSVLCYDNAPRCFFLQRRASHIAFSISPFYSFIPLKTLNFTMKIKNIERGFSLLREGMTQLQTSNASLKHFWCSYATTAHQMFYSHVQRTVTTAEKVPVNTVANTLTSFQTLWGNLKQLLKCRETIRLYSVFCAATVYI